MIDVWRTILDICSSLCVLDCEFSLSPNTNVNWLHPIPCNIKLITGTGSENKLPRAVLVESSSPPQFLYPQWCWNPAHPWCRYSQSSCYAKKAKFEVVTVMRNDTVELSFYAGQYLYSHGIIPCLFSYITSIVHHRQDQEVPLFIK